jgi:Flp pilus assembly pilin Flp
MLEGRQAINVAAGRVQEEMQMVGMLLNAFVASWTAPETLLARARNERGATLMEYALVVGLIAVVAVVVVAALGRGVSGLFGSANTCVGGLNSTSC